MENASVSTSKFVGGDSEAVTRRLETLHQLDILDTAPEAAFDRITALATRLFKVPIALVSLLDADRQWFKSAQGLEVCQTGLEESFCRHAVRDYELHFREVFVVQNALQDARFGANVLVTGPPHVRFYAGAPLLSPDGVAVGTLCIIDTEPREFDASARQTLMDLAAVLGDELELRRTRKLLQQRESSFRALIENSSDIITVLDEKAYVIYETPSAERLLGYASSELRNQDVMKFIHPDDVERVRETFARVVAAPHDNIREEVEFRFMHRDGSWRHLESLSRNLLQDAAVRGIVVNSRDITQRLKQEAALRQSEESFQNAFEYSDIGMALVGLDGKWLRINESLCKFLGYSEAEMRQMDFQRVTFPADLSRDLEQVQQLLSGTIRSYSIEKRYIRADGEVVWAMLNVSLVRDDEGRPLNFISQVQDISERKRVLRAMQRSEARKAAVLETALDCIVTIDHEGRVLEWNPAAESTFGFSAAQAIGQELHEMIVPPELRDAHRNGLGNYLETGEGPVLNRRIEMPAVHADGRRLTVELAIVPILSDPPVFTGHLRDITERRSTEERLRLLESVVVHANDAVIITEAEPFELPGPRIVYVNEAFTKSTGYSAEEAIGQTPRLLQGADTSPATRARIREALGKWQPIEVEVLNYRKDGTSFWVELSIVPLADATGWYTHWISIQRDVSARRQSADDLLRAKEIAESAREDAETANRAKSEFLGRMSHELRTPLNAILGFGQLLELSSLPKEDADSTRQIVKAGRHLLLLINEVLDIARIESGHLSLSIEPVEVGAIVRETLSLVRPLAAQRDIVPNPDSLLQHAHWVRADRQRFKQVWLNLLSNAVKYNREGGQIELNCEVRDGHVHFSVRDSGEGIAPDLLPRLFTPFDRLGAESRGIEGTGVGLTLCKYLVEAMHGTISVDSQVGIGTTFHFSLPVSDNPALTFVETIVADVTVQHSASVLYIEDNKSNLELMARLLARQPKIALHTAINGQLGLELAAQKQPDLILLDFNLPGMNGGEILRHLQNDPTTCHIPVVIVSADATAGQVQRLKDAGARDYVTKPFDIADLLRVLQENLP